MLDTIGSSFDTVLYAFTGSSVSALTFRASNDNASPGSNSRIIFTVTAGTTYRIAVDGGTLSIDPEGSIVLSLRLATTAPPNDTFANSIAITGLTNTVTGDNLGATIETGEPSNSSTLRSVWWKWTAPTNATVTLTTTGSAFAPGLAVYRGTAVSALTAVSPTSPFQALAGTNYQIRVSGSANEAGFVTLNLSAVPRPLNDAFTNRTTITGLTNTVTGHNIGATTDAGEFLPYIGMAGHTVWWSWTAPTNAAVFIDTTGSSISTIIAVQVGTSVSGLSSISTAFELSQRYFRAVAGVTYHLAVDGNSSAWGNIVLNLRAVPTQANDSFSNRFSIAGMTNQVQGYTLGATREVGEPPHAGNSLGRTVWWTWNAPTNGNVRLEWTGPANVFVYQGTAVSNLTLVPSISTNGYPLSALTFLGQAGESYQIAVEGTGAPSDYTLGLKQSFPAAPEIQASPVGTTIPTRRTTAFSVTAGGTIPLRYQWRKDGQDIPGATNTAFTITSTQTTNSGVYSVVITNNYGSVVSSGAALTVIPPPINDDFYNALPLSGFSSSASGMNFGATSEPNEAGHFGGQAKASVWWFWVAPASGVVVADTFGSSFDTVLAVYQGSSLTNLTLLANNNNAGTNVASQAGFVSQAGQLYWLAVDGANNATGSIALSLQVRPPPANDDFAARAVVSGTSNVVFGSVFGATSQPDEPNQGYPSVWWTWQAPETKAMRIAVISSQGATLGIYSGTVLSNLVSVGLARGSSTTFSAREGEEYQIRIGSYQLGADFRMELQPVPEPTNNHFTNRALLIGTPALVAGNNLGATLEQSEPAHSNAQRSVWWTWTPTLSGRVAILDKGSYPAARIEVYSGAVLGALTNMGNPFTAVAGQSYQICVSGVFQGYETGDIKFGFNLLNWDVISLQTSTNAQYEMPFHAQVLVSYAGSGSPNLRVRTIATPGSSWVEGDPPPSLPAERALATNFLAPRLIAGASNVLAIAAVCPPPDPLPDAGAINSGLVWGVFLVLEEEAGTNWFLRDKKFLFLGQWPNIVGPPGGLVILDPNLNSPAFNLFQVSQVSIFGLVGLKEGTTGLYYGSAIYQNGLIDTFTNGQWTSSLFTITNGVFTAGGVTSNTPIALTAVYSAFGLDYIGTMVVTVSNLPPPALSAFRGPGTNSVSLTVFGVPGRNHVVEAASSLGSPPVWTPFSTNKVDDGGTANLTNSVQGGFSERYYRVREVP